MSVMIQIRVDGDYRVRGAFAAAAVGTTTAGGYAPPTATTTSRTTATTTWASACAQLTGAVAPLTSRRSCLVLFETSEAKGPTE